MQNHRKRPLVNKRTLHNASTTILTRPSGSDRLSWINKLRTVFVVSVAPDGRTKWRNWFTEQRRGAQSRRLWYGGALFWKSSTVPATVAAYRAIMLAEPKSGRPPQTSFKPSWVRVGNWRATTLPAGYFSTRCTVIGFFDAYPQYEANLIGGIVT